MNRTYLISLLGHVALVATASAVLDLGYLFGNGRLVAALAAALLLLGGGPLAARRWFRGLRARGSRGQMPLWALPLAQLAVTIGLLISALWAPHACGTPDLWRDLLDVSPGPFTDVVLMAGLLLLGSALASFALLCAEWLRHGMALEVTEDASTRVAMHASAAGLLGLLMMLSAYPTENVEYLRAWKLYAWDRKPGDALELFRRIAARPEPAKLADNALFRMAMIARNQGQRAQAMEALEQLQRRMPRSPLVEDAVFMSGQVALAAGDRSGARAAFERVLAEWPRSYRADDALASLAGIARAGGGHAAAEALVRRLETEYGWRYVEVDGPRGRPRYVRAAAAAVLTSP